MIHRKKIDEAVPRKVTPFQVPLNKLLDPPAKTQQETTGDILKNNLFSLSSKKVGLRYAQLSHLSGIISKQFSYGKKYFLRHTSQLLFQYRHQLLAVLKQQFKRNWLTLLCWLRGRLRAIIWKCANLQGFEGNNLKIIT